MYNITKMPAYETQKTIGHPLQERICYQPTRYEFPVLVSVVGKLSFVSCRRIGTQEILDHVFIEEAHMCRVGVAPEGAPIRICYFYPTPRQRNSMQLVESSDRVGQMLKHIEHNHRFNGIRFNRPREDREIVNNIHPFTCHTVKAHESGPFISTTADIKFQCPTPLLLIHFCPVRLNRRIIEAFRQPALSLEIQVL